MYAITGQTKIVKQLTEYTLSNMPTTILLLGPRGGGKSLITSRFAKKLGIPLVELNSATTAEELTEYEHCYETRLYHLDLVGIDEKKQNKFLYLL